RRTASRRGGGRVGVLAEPHGHWRPEQAMHLVGGNVGGLGGGGARGEAAREPIKLAALLVLLARPRGEAADQRAGTAEREEREQVARVVDVERVARLREEEVERHDARCRGRQ